MTTAQAGSTPFEDRSRDGALAARQLGLVLAAVAIAAVRLYFCARTPVSTGDALRHLYTGLYVLERGLGAAGIPLVTLNPALDLSFASLPYNYPPVTLGFFTLLALVSPTVFAIKLGLTLIEGANAVMVGRLAGNRWIGLVYWALPTSIWYVSGEAQFEPLQTLFVLAALLAFRRSVALAFVLLALAVQVKLSAVLLLPWLVWRTHRDRSDQLPAGALAFLLGFFPTFAASAFYPVISSIRSTTGSMIFNPYHWNVADPVIYAWVPTWVRAANALATWGALALLVAYARRSSDRAAFIAPGLFLLTLKAASLGQFWYVLLWPAFVLPIPERRTVWRLIALTVLLDVYSLAQLVVGPIAWNMYDYWAGMTAFTRHSTGS